MEFYRLKSLHFRYISKISKFRTKISDLGNFLYGICRFYAIYTKTTLTLQVQTKLSRRRELLGPKKLCMSAFHTPAFIASVLGILAGLSKVVICLIDSPFGGAYLAVEGILTTSVTAIILIVVGYSMELTKELIRPCLKTILMRVLLQTLMAIGVLWAVHLWIGDNMLLNLAIISYMSAPATFSMQTFLKKEEGSAYVSTTNSMYCMVSILVYIILAAVVY